MRMMMFVITEIVIKKQSSPAKMESVFLSFGSATMTMTVVMTVMNQLISADIETVPQDGEDAPATPTTDVSLNGCFVMARMTAEIKRMSNQRIVQNVKKREISNAETSDVFHKDGCVTLRMTVETIPMKLMPCVLEGTVSARSQNFNVIMTSASPRDGSVTMMMTAEMAVMKLAA